VPDRMIRRRIYRRSTLKQEVKLSERYLEATFLTSQKRQKTLNYDENQADFKIIVIVDQDRRRQILSL
jgi:hypothetical protein